MANRLSRTPLRRKTAHAQVHPSINVAASRGSGTLQSFIPGLGLDISPTNITAVTKGDDLERSPLHEERPDVLRAGCLPVMARSGNDSEQLSDEGDNEAYTMVGDMTPAEAAAAATQRPNAGLGLGAGVLIALAGLWLLEQV